MDLNKGIYAMKAIHTTCVLFLASYLIANSPAAMENWEKEPPLKSLN